MLAVFFVVKSISKEFRTKLNITHLTLLTPQLIALDRLTNDPFDPRSITGVLDTSSKRFKNSTISAEIDRVKDVIGTLATPAKDTNLIFVFTDNPLIGLTVGRYPNGAESCQKYWHGTDTLAAYPSDSMTKICLLIDKSKLPTEVLAKLEVAKTEEEKLKIFNESTYRFLEAMIARRVTKVVKQSDTQQEQLFLEPIYTSHDRKQMTRIMNTCARGVLQTRVGIPLVTGGGETTVEVAASRNTQQYEDGECGGPQDGGLGSKEGNYTMSARALVDKDYL